MFDPGRPRDARSVWRCWVRMPGQLVGHRLRDACLAPSESLDESRQRATLSRERRGRSISEHRLDTTEDIYVGSQDHDQKFKVSSANHMMHVAQSRLDHRAMSHFGVETLSAEPLPSLCQILGLLNERFVYVHDSPLSHS